MTLTKQQFKPILDAIGRVRPEVVFIDSTNHDFACSGSNGSISFEVKFSLVEQDNAPLGKITLNANLFATIINKLPYNDFVVEKKDNFVTIKSGLSTFKLTIIENDDFEFYGTNENTFVIPCVTLYRLVSKTSFAAAQKENRAILVGINLSASIGEVSAIGLDGARMSKYKTNINDGIQFNITVSSKEIESIISLFDINKDVTISTNGKRIEFSQDSTRVATSLINGDYPDTKRLIPASSEISLTFSKIDLISALDSVSILSNEKHVIKLTSADRNHCILESTNEEIGSAKQIVECEKEGENDLEIYFNVQYLLEALKVIESERVTIQFNGALRPFFIKEENDLVELFTPIRL